MTQCLGLLRNLIPTVRKYLPRRLDHGRRKDIPSQRWRTFVVRDGYSTAAHVFAGSFVSAPTRASTAPTRRATFDPGRPASRICP
jgi:hypothetical protein